MKLIKCDVCEKVVKQDDGYILKFQDNQQLLLCNTNDVCLDCLDKIVKNISTIKGDPTYYSETMCEMYGANLCGKTNCPLFKAKLCSIPDEIE